jgi:hypothetical protein
LSNISDQLKPEIENGVSACKSPASVKQSIKTNSEKNENFPDEIESCFDSKQYDDDDNQAQKSSD